MRSQILGEVFSGSETHAILMKNDNSNHISFVEETLIGCLGISQEKARIIARRVHYEGIAIVWTGNKAEGENRLKSMLEAGLNCLIIDLGIA